MVAHRAGTAYSLGLRDQSPAADFGAEAASGARVAAAQFPICSSWELSATSLCVTMVVMLPVVKQVVPWLLVGLQPFARLVNALLDVLAE